MLIPEFMVVSLAFIWPDSLKSVNEYIDLSAVPYWCKITVFLIFSYLIGIVNSGSQKKYGVLLEIIETILWHGRTQSIIT